MNKSGKTVLVIGATGQQGGSTINALLADGWRTRALVRDIGGTRARALAAAGVEIRQGDLRDAGSVKVAAEGAYALFFALPSSGQPQYGMTDADELAFGEAVADAARRAGIEHLIYSSLAGATDDLGVGHIEAKAAIEKTVQALRLDTTIIRPTAFMELLCGPPFAPVDGVMTFFQQPSGKMQFIAAKDIGRIVAAVLANRDQFKARCLDIAGDELTGDQLAEKVSRATGRQIGYRQFPPEFLSANPMLARLVELVEQGQLKGDADIPALRGLVPGLLTFDDWLAAADLPRLGG